jgi:hypothetical protein
MIIHRSFVIAGLDPAIHNQKRCMHARVKARMTIGDAACRVTMGQGN